MFSEKNGNFRVSCSDPTHPTNPTQVLDEVPSVMIPPLTGQATDPMGGFMKNTNGKLFQVIPMIWLIPLAWHNIMMAVNHLVMKFCH